MRQRTAERDEILDRISDDLRKSLDPNNPVPLDSLPDVRHGNYGLRKDPTLWAQYAQWIGEAFRAVSPYRILDMGCNVGAKSPLLTGWGCIEYLGIDNRSEVIEVANRRWRSGVCGFQVVDIVKEALPTGFDVVALIYVLQHLPITAKRRVLSKIAAGSPRTVLLIDKQVLPKTIAECREIHQETYKISKGVPFPEAELCEIFGDYKMQVPHKLFRLLERVE